MNIIKLSATDSTNSYLKTRARTENLPNGTVVRAETQLKGRGQGTTSWVSQPGKNLAFSLYWKTSGLEASRQFDLSMSVSLAVRTVLSDLEIPEVSVKWPNDILSGSKKVCGILIENILSGPFVKYSIIGIGLNVNQDDFEDLPRAASLKMQTGKELDRDAVFMKLIREILRNLERFPQSEKDRSDLREEYESMLFARGVVSDFEDAAGNRFQGSIEGISSRGELVVNSKGLKRIFQFKEVTLLY